MHGKLTIHTEITNTLKFIISRSFNKQSTEEGLRKSNRGKYRKSQYNTKPSKMVPTTAAAALNNQIQLTERCTLTGKEEIQRLSDGEIKEFRQALIDYAESQMKAAQESYEILQEQVTKLQNWRPE